MVLIFSEHSNKSEQVLREVQLASNSHLHIVQFRIQDVIPNDDLEYYLSAPHWLDALVPPLENHLERLKGSVKALLQMDAGEPVAPSERTAAEKQGRDAVAPKLAERAFQPPSSAIPAQSRPRSLWMPALTAVAVLCAILLVVFLLRQRE